MHCVPEKTGSASHWLPKFPCPSAAAGAVVVLTHEFQSLGFHTLQSLSDAASITGRAAFSRAASATNRKSNGAGERCAPDKRAETGEKVGGRLPDAAYHEAEILNNKINQRFSALMERDLPGLSLPEQALGAH
jgi:hypothetical protein